jgi:hypothetical protein
MERGEQMAHLARRRMATFLQNWRALPAARLVCCGMFVGDTAEPEAQVNSAQKIFEAIGVFARAWQAVNADLLEQAASRRRA